MLDRIEWELGPEDQEQPIEFGDRNGRMLVRWRGGQPPTLGMFKLLNALTNIDEDDCSDKCEEPPQAC